MVMMKATTNESYRSSMFLRATKSLCSRFSTKTYNFLLS